jgi:hypothetical protein
MGLWGEEPAARAVYGGGDSPLHENPSPPPSDILGAELDFCCFQRQRFLLSHIFVAVSRSLRVSLFDISCRPNAHFTIFTAIQSFEQKERLNISLSSSNRPINLAFDSDSSLVPSFKVADVQVSAITFFRPLLGTAFMIFCGTTTRPP